jgi:hypothetical protein
MEINIVISWNQENFLIMQKKNLSIQTSRQSYFPILGWSSIYYGIGERQILKPSSNSWWNYMVVNFEKSRFESLDWQDHVIGHVRLSYAHKP